MTPTGRGSRVLRVAHVIHSLEEGGAEALLLELARVAPAAGVRMSVVSLMPIVRRRYADALEALGVDVVTLDLSSRWDLRAFSSRSLEPLRRWGVELVHAHLKHADLVGAFAASRLGVPLVSTLHVIEERPGLLGTAKREVAALARSRFAARTIAVSDAQRSWYAGLRGSSDSVVTVRNGVRRPPIRSAAERTVLREAVGAGEDTVLVAAVGVLRPEKGHADLVAAIAALPAGLRVRAVVAGDGPGGCELARLAAPLGARVGLLGWVDDVSAVLEAADVVAHPSTADALPTALLEAAAAGRPVVATRVGGIPEIVSEATGLLVPPRDPPALAAALETLVVDPDLRRRMGTAARERFDREFAADAWAARLRAVYDDVLAGRAVAEPVG